MQQILFREAGEQNEIIVYDTDEYGGSRGRFRVLQFSEQAMQGALDLDRPERILFEYPQAMLHLMACGGGSSGSVFLIGHGIGTIARHCAGKRVKVAELDAQVVELSKRFFGYCGPEPGVGDGRALLAGEGAGSHDFIVLDAFSDKGTPRHLTSRGFFGLAASKLEEETGTILVNLMGKSENDAHIAAIHTTLRQSFPNVKSFALPAARAADRRNYILAGSFGAIPYQSRKMAGFTEIELGHGYIIEDND